nr:Transcriptional regulator, AraC family [Kibdelosporangium sp. MJ126-NF4]CTQ96937.1 Transcriptional regulator, AraC family [Kibdelosporangium sp. MJ126-NF4]
MMTRGQTRIKQGRGDAELGPTDLVLLDPTRTIRFESTAAAHVTILVPRRELRIRPAQIDRLIGVRIDGSHGPGALVSVLARESARSATEFREAEALRSRWRLGWATDNRPRTSGCGTGSPATSRPRLADPDLSPPRIAAAHHISVRRLHKLFEDQPLTVAAPDPPSPP